VFAQTQTEVDIPKREGKCFVKTTYLSKRGLPYQHACGGYGRDISHISRYDVSCRLFLITSVPTSMARDTSHSENHAIVLDKAIGIEQAGPDRANP
jgi:hypothetical protein